MRLVLIKLVLFAFCGAMNFFFYSLAPFDAMKAAAFWLFVAVSFVLFVFLAERTFLSIGLYICSFAAMNAVVVGFGNIVEGNGIIPLTSIGLFGCILLLLNSFLSRKLIGPDGSARNTD